jgi:hypothetical protein
MTTTRRWSRFATILLLVTLAGLGVRLVFIYAGTNEKVGGDALYYHEGANLLAEGKGYIDPYRYLFGGKEQVTLADGRVVEVVTPVGHVEPTAGHPPVYVTYLGVASWFGLDTVRDHQVVSALLGAVSIVLAGLLGRALVDERVGIIAAVLTAVYANIWINDGLVMSETAAIVFAFLTSLMGLRFWRSPTVANGVWFALAAGFAALSRAELVLFLPIVAAVALWRAPLPWRTRVFRYAVVGVVGVAVITPWIVRNNMVMEERVLLSDGAGTVAIQANCDATYYGRYIGFWNLECGGPQPHGPNGELLDESQRDVVVRKQATEYISSHTTRLVTVVVPARIGRMWGLYQPIDQVRLDIVEGRPAFAAWLGFWQYVVLVPFAVAGAVIQWRRRGPLLVVGLWVVLATITAATAFGSTRYRTAAEVSVVVLAAVAIDGVVRLLRHGPVIGERTGRRSWRPGGGAVEAPAEPSDAAPAGTDPLGPGTAVATP